MATRRISIVASLTLACMPGLYGQIVPVSDNAQRGMASLQQRIPREEDRSAAIREATDDVSDDCRLAGDTLIRPSSGVSRPHLQRKALLILVLLLPTSATLESQHVLLRL